ncbi:hypothetical protein TcasGA2_TC004204 [Tribolium castaneum]|uniref:Phospholipase A2-like domain-containing protein n=1 Tax=Tribolium castaneum TaxID=7070 RepID=D7EJ38_TRICA|nr:hypothetical protein TcasGA2_TC004204 [Tribolium castaneum]
MARGEGLLNSSINKLPIELHFPGYQYCGPGTKLAKRLNRQDPGINKLDQYCKVHDIEYSKSNNLKDRHKADQILENKAWSRVISKDAKFGEKASAWLVTNIMKLKRKLGMGIKRTTKKKTIKKKKTRKCQRGIKRTRKCGRGMKKTRQQQQQQQQQQHNGKTKMNLRKRCNTKKKELDFKLVLLIV